MIVPNYNQFGGIHYETASLQKVLAHAKVVAPHTNQPFSEELLFGLGSGLGITYFVFEFGHSSFMYIGPRYHNGLVEDICKRLGVTTNLKETAGAKAAEKQLKQVLEQGQPALVWCDLASLPFYGLPPELIKYMVHILVVYGLDEEQAYVADLSTSPLNLTPGELSFSRAAITSQKNRLLTVEPSAQIENLPEVVLEAIRRNCQQMLEPAIANFGLKGLKKWADLLTNAKDKKGWPRVFPAGVHLYNALKNVFFYLEIYGTGGGSFRPMYARFLEEAAIITGEAELREIAEQYRELAVSWMALANAALPDSVGPFQQTKQLLVRRSKLLQEQGMAARPEMQELTAQLDAIARESANFPMSQAGIDKLLAELRERVMQLYEAEAQAITALQVVVDKASVGYSTVGISTK